MELFYPSNIWQHCPYCGSTHINWGNGTHQMACSACGRIFFINASAAVVALIQNDKKELLITHRKNDPAKGTLDLPGGFVDLNETAEEAIKREVKEELNIIVEDLNFFGSFPNRYLYGGIVYFTLDLVFRCTVNDFSSLSAADDVADFDFISLNDIKPDRIGLESIRNVILKFKEQ